MPIMLAKHKYIFLKALLIVITIFITYLPAIEGGFIWDDDKYVTENQLLTAPDGLKRIWLSRDVPSQYFPLTYTVFWIEYRLWGFNPTGYHIVNVILHAINALLVWLMLNRLSIPGAWFAALIFALHPVHVESVAWVTELKNILSCTFFLLAVLAWLKYIDKSVPRPWALYPLTMIFYMLALFSKTTAVTLPLTLLLIIWFQFGRINRRDVVLTIPFVLLGLAMGLLTMWWERYHQGTQGNEFAFTLIERVLIASRSLWFHPSKLLWPTELTFSYPRWEIDPGNPLQYGWLIGLIFAVSILWQLRSLLGRGVVAAIAFYVVNLTPMLGFIALYTFRYTFVADHYQYIASIGLIALFAAAITKIWEKRNMRLEVLWIFFFIIIVTFGVLSWRQAHIYKDKETLWRDTIRKNPASWMGHNNLANTLFSQGRVEEAITHYFETLRIKPDYAEAHFNMGRAFMKKGRTEEAILHYSEALKLNPDFAYAHVNIGNALVKAGKVYYAIMHYSEAIRISPNFADAYYNLGNAFVRLGRLEEAAAQYRKVLRIKPDQAMARYNLELIVSGELRETGENETAPYSEEEPL